MKPFQSELSGRLGVRWNVTVWWGQTRKQYGFHHFDNAMAVFRMERKAAICTRVEIEPV